MSDWYFVRDGARVGPQPRQDVQALLASGELPPSTLVWTTGMETWRPASETPELAEPADAPAYPTYAFPEPDARPAYWADPRVAADDEPALMVGARATPYPWRRWTARLIDMFCFGFLLGAVLAVVAPDAVAQANPIAMNVLVLALFVPVEALVLSGTGSTPGKRLLRIHVTHADGSRLAFGTAMERSVQVWLRGLGLGLPLVSAVTMVMSYLTLSGEGRTAWDHKLGLRVTHGEMSAPRWAGVAVVLALVIAVLAAASAPAA
jgi:hypothetical protein